MTRPRDALVRRNTRLLVVAQGAVLAANAVFFVLAVVAIDDLTGKERWAGVLLALFNLSAAASALFVGRLMDRVGRRPGLALGHGLYILVGLGGALAVWAESPWALLAVSVPGGAALGACLLGRVAVADMYPVELRGKLVGIVVAAGTAGAILGPPLVAGIERLADSTVAPWFLVAALEVIGLVAVLSLRPDPTKLAVHEPIAGASGRRRTVRELLHLAPMRAAVATIGVAQAAMVATMGVAPIVIDDRGGGSLAIALVISVHIAGMYALAPVIGTLLDHYGRRPGLIAGGVLSAAGAVLGSFTEATVLVGTGLFLVGLGWSACYLGATAAISDLTEPFERGGALGFTDLFTSVASAAGALAGGFVLESAGIAVVGIAMAALMTPALLLVLPLREPAPGRWAPAGAGSST